MKFSIIINHKKKGGRNCSSAGLVHIKSTCNAEQTKLYVENKLDEFESDIKTDVISSTHDGATIMVKYGRILGIISQLCYKHGLRLAIAT